MNLQQKKLFAVKINHFALIAIIMLLICSPGLFGQGNRQSDREINLANVSATQVSDYTDKTRQTEIFSEAKSYMQKVVVAAKETKIAAANAEKLLIEQEKQISNSGDKVLIENIKDQREEITLALQEATLALDWSEKAAQANDLEKLHTYAWDILKASKKIIKQLEAAQQYSSITTQKK
ncbi:MAG: hypothetical protein ACT4ON_11665 [Bacteroidota bacterium]